MVDTVGGGGGGGGGPQLGEWNMTPVGASLFTADSAGAFNATVGGVAGAYTVAPVSATFTIVQANENFTDVSGLLSLVHETGIGAPTEFYFGFANPEMTPADILSSLGGSMPPSGQVIAVVAPFADQFQSIILLPGQPFIVGVIDTNYMPTVGQKVFCNIEETATDYVMKAYNEGDTPWTVTSFAKSLTTSGLRPFVMIDWSDGTTPSPLTIALGGVPGVVAVPGDKAVGMRYKVTGAGTYAGKTAGVGDIVEFLTVTPDTLFVSTDVDNLATQDDLNTAQAALNDSITAVDDRVVVIETDFPLAQARALCNGSLRGYLYRGASINLWGGGWNNQPIGSTVLDGNDGTVWTKVNPETDGATAAVLFQWTPRIGERFTVYVQDQYSGNIVTQVVVRLAEFVEAGTVATGMPTGQIYAEGNSGIPIPMDLGYALLHGDFGLSYGVVVDPAPNYTPQRNMNKYTRITYSSAGIYNIDTSLMAPGEYFFHIELPAGSGIQVSGGFAGIFHQTDASGTVPVILHVVIVPDTLEAFVHRIKSCGRVELGTDTVGQYDISVDMDSVSTFSLPKNAKTITLTGAAGPYTLTVTGDSYGNEETPVLVKNTSSATVTLQSSGAVTKFSDVTLPAGGEVVFGVVRQKWRKIAS